VQQALRAGEDRDAPRRADLLAQIQDAQERRDEARRDYAGRVIDRADWLDIRQRTEDEIGAARRDYDRLAGSATVLGDIPASERVRDAWEAWSTDRRRAAIRAVLVRVLIKPLPADASANVAGNSKNTALRGNGNRRSCGSASNSTGACSDHAAHRRGGRRVVDDGPVDLAVLVEQVAEPLAHTVHERDEHRVGYVLHVLSCFLVEFQ